MYVGTEERKKISISTFQKHIKEIFQFLEIFCCFVWVFLFSSSFTASFRHLILVLFIDYCYYYVDVFQYSTLLVCFLSMWNDTSLKYIHAYEFMTHLWSDMDKCIKRRILYSSTLYNGKFYSFHLGFEHFSLWFERENSTITWFVEWKGFFFW